MNTPCMRTLATLALVGTSPFAVGETATDSAKPVDRVEHIVVRGAYFGQAAADAVKTPTLLLDVPQSVSIVTADQISEQGLFSIADVMQYTPGVSIGQGEDHRDQITIRGQNTTADFFIDGLRDDVQYFRPLYNLERVEVLRGANALLFGRGGGGGVVNRVTKVAELSEDFSTVTANLDTFSAGGVAVDANHAIGRNQAIRLNATVDTVENHRDFKDGDRFAVNPTWSWVGDAGTIVNASYEFIDDDRVVDRGVPSLDGEPLRDQDDTFFGDPDLNRTTFRGHIARLRAEQSLSSSWTINGTLQYADYDKTYRNLYPIGFSQADGTVSLDGYDDGTTRENTLLQINAVGQFETLGLAHTLLLGAEYGAQDTENARRDTLFAASNDDQITFAFTNPLAIPAVGFTAPVRDRASEVTFTSMFVQDEIALGDHWILVAGLRYDRFEIDVVDAIEAANGAQDGNDGFLGSSDTELSPRLGLIYKPIDNLSIYASYSQSFLPRSGDQFLSLDLTTRSLDPEEFENREVGLKWNVSDRLNFTAAAFEVMRENGTAVDPANPERSVLTGSRTRGLELQLVGNVTDAWEINAGYSYLDGRELGRFVGGREQNRDLAQLPEHMFSLWNRFNFSRHWGAGLGVIHQAEQYASLSNAVELPDFTRVDAAVYYQYDDRLQVQLGIENLLDAEMFPAAHNDNNITTGEPLNARLSVQYRL
ncbi:MAG TPA: TonB-dependent siderophore receptor [Pseudomonadales bacterium]|nr:TonB-dependent siderophore receptor [Pseudomonadales bacterium]